MFRKETKCVKACCFHNYTGAIWMVIPNGHVVQQCCECGAMRTIHAEHGAWIRPMRFKKTRPFSSRLAEHRADNSKVAGAAPARGTNFYG